MEKAETLDSINEEIQTVPDEDIEIISKKLIEKNFEAYKELASR